MSPPWSIAAGITHEIAPIKGSRFIAIARPIANEAAGQDLIAEARDGYTDATHHCWAWRILRPAIDRCSDDGEPSGSAGRPMLAQLAGRDLVNSALVVVRYFGGTKLGVGGLVRAYGTAAGEVLDRCQLIPATIPATIAIHVGYGDVEPVERTISSLGATIVDATYTDSVHLTVRIDETRQDELISAISDATAGRVTIVEEPETP